MHEVAFSKSPLSDNSQGFHRLECLYACLNATKSWFDLFLTVLPASYIEFSLSVFTQLAHCVIVLYRLSTFEHPDWDVVSARETANLLFYLEQVVKKMSSVKQAAGLDTGKGDDIDIYSITCQKLGSIKTWWDAKLAVDRMRGPHGASLQSDTIVDSAVSSQDAFMRIDLNLPDDVWLRELLPGPWDYTYDP